MGKFSDRGDLYILTDEEHDQRVKEQKRKELLDRLSKASANKKTKKAVEKKEPEPYQPPKKKTFDSSYKDYAESKFEEGVMRLGWDSFMDQMQDSYDLSSPTRLDVDEGTILGSPIDVAAGENIAEFSRYFDESEPYDNLFKDEIAMTSEILKELKDTGKLVSQKVKAMSAKGPGGVTKSYSDLITAVTSIRSTQLNAIDKIAGWKLKREELKIKVRKEMPDLGDDVDSIVDEYYAKYVVGNPIGGSKSKITPMEAPSSRDEFDASEMETAPRVPNRSFNLTEPKIWGSQSFNGEQMNADPHGYIRHSGKGVEVCIERLPSGNLSFVAIDANGEYLDDYEVPSQEMLESIQISPISKYASDKAGRRYRVIDFNEAIDLDEDLG